MASLEKTCATVGYPRALRVDQSSEFISRDLDLWGLMPLTSPWTFFDQANRRKMRSSKRLMGVLSGRSALMHIGS